MYNGSVMAGNSENKSAVGLQTASSSAFSTDGCPIFLPAAGNRNGTDFNNRGSNGNCWSGSLNSNNSNNAYNLNFNSNGNNWNNNNRNNGFSVRPVSELTARGHCNIFACKVSPEQLLVDLFRAYKDARKHKRGRKYQLEFELNLEEELVKLRDEIVARCYTPGISTCFIITDPKKREVFAAGFRDRIVHHLYYNYTRELFERTFIADSYSCRKNKGTHYGFKRLRHHIRSVSQNYTRRCYVMKTDVLGYFMHIDRERLLGICVDTLMKMSVHMSDVKGKRWCEKLDFDLLFFLSRVIIMNNPVENCRICGSADDRKGLPRSKSLFHSNPGCGLPIGNLTSQLFSNVYMNVFDEYVKRKLPGFSYGRYVDDAFFVSTSKRALRLLIPELNDFLNAKLDLQLHPGKILITDCRFGVEFLGGFCKPYRCYISNKSLCRMKRKVKMINDTVVDATKLRASVNSFLGVLSHYSAYRIKRNLFSDVSNFCKYGYFKGNFRKYVLKSENVG